MDNQPVLGKIVEVDGLRNGKIYTRTVVLWAVGLIIDTKELWKHVQVRATSRMHPLQGTRMVTRPIVRMMSTSTDRRGGVPKRLRRKPFRSVLSMDIEYLGCMPNLRTRVLFFVPLSKTDL